MNIKQMNMIQTKVEEVLREDINARKDDFILISKVLEKTNPETKYMTIGDCLQNGRVLGLPSFSSITRARRKIFKKYPELIPEDSKFFRMKEEKTYKKWSKKE